MVFGQAMLAAEVIATVVASERKSLFVLLAIVANHDAGKLVATIYLNISVSALGSRENV